MRVFFDASVLIAGLLSSNGGSAKLLKLVNTGDIVGFISQSVIIEVSSKSNKLQKTTTEIENYFKESKIIVRKTISNKEIKHYQNAADKEDAHLIAGAILTKCDYLVTLDKRHLYPSHLRMLRA